MKTIKAYEFKDLSKDIKEKVFNRFLESEIEFQIEILTRDLEEERITEEDYYKVLGCSKSYTETTAWFVPSCYHEKHEKELNKEVRKQLKDSLFNSFGVSI